MDYIYVIDKKIQEYRFRIEEQLIELNKYRGQQPSPELLQKVMICKDIITLNGGAVRALEDLRKELTDVTPKLL